MDVWSRGKSLHETLEEHGAYATREAARLLLPIAAELTPLHDAALVHHGVSTSGILLGTDMYGRDSPRLLPPHSSRETPFTYVAPELLQGASTATPSVDVWALGIVLYELLSSDVPFERVDEAYVVHALRTDTLIPIRARRSGLDPEIVDVVNTALAMDRSIRYPSARDFGEALAIATSTEHEWQLALTLAMNRVRLQPLTLAPTPRTQLASPMPDRNRPTRSARLAVLLGALALIGIAGWAFAATRYTSKLQTTTIASPSVIARQGAARRELPQVSSTPTHH